MPLVTARRRKRSLLPVTEMHSGPLYIHRECSSTLSPLPKGKTQNSVFFYLTIFLCIIYQMQILPSKLPNKSTTQLVYLVLEMSLYFLRMK